MGPVSTEHGHYFLGNRGQVYPFDVGLTVLQVVKKKEYSVHFPRISYASSQLVIQTRFDLLYSTAYFKLQYNGFLSRSPGSNMEPHTI